MNHAKIFFSSLTLLLFFLVVQVVFAQLSQPRYQEPRASPPPPPVMQEQELREVESQPAPIADRPIAPVIPPAVFNKIVDSFVNNIVNTVTVVFGFIQNIFGFGDGGGVTASVSSSALVVNDTSHIVVMEYEPWFGPGAVDFHTAAATPLLRSASVPFGYDSADRAVIRQHAKWLQELGVDALLVDFTNGMECLMPREHVPEPVFGSCSEVFKIKNNIAVLYDEFDKLRQEGGMPIKLIPLVGAQFDSGLNRSSPHKSGTELLVEFFESLMRQYPELNVIYEGKPLVVIFHGAPQSLVPPDDWWKQTRELFQAKGFSNRLTLRQMVGFLEHQPQLLEPDSNKVKPRYAFWPWMDRFKPQFGYIPTYVNNPSGNRVEAFTASIGSFGRGREVNKQNGLNPPCFIHHGVESCHWGNGRVYAPDAGLRRQGATFREYMQMARELKPIFLFIHQWNEFLRQDEGWDEETTTDMEPTGLWGFEPYQMAQREITTYKKNAGNIINFSVRGFVGTGDEVLIGGFIIDGSENLRVALRGHGPSLPGEVGERLRNPRITLFRGSEAVAANDDFQPEATPAIFHPANSRESLLVLDLAPGPYTVHLADTEGNKGVGIVEIFDVHRFAGTGDPDARLMNASGRGLVGKGGEQMIGGLIKQAGTRSIVALGRGESMEVPFPVIQDPAFLLYRDQRKMGEFDDFGNQDREILDRLRNIGGRDFIAELTSRETATFVSLADPARQAYTAILRDKAASAAAPSCEQGGCRVGIIEFFDADAYELAAARHSIEVQVREPVPNSALAGTVPIRTHLNRYQGDTVLSYVIVGQNLIYDSEGNISFAGDRVLARSAVTGSAHVFLWDTLAKVKTARHEHKLGDGSYTLRVVVYDAAGNFGWEDVSIRLENDTTPPRVNILRPQEGARLSGRATVEATAADDRGVVELRFVLWKYLLPFDFFPVAVAERVFGAPPYVWDIDTRNFSDRSYRIVAEARDSAGNAGFASVNVEINN